MEASQKHFVLVHGICHGAWCWYKLKPLLESAGYKVTALDLAASGSNLERIEELRTFYDYSAPLLEYMASLPPDEKVILVGHSLGGMNLAFSMENFPKKISVAIFVTAYMPDTVHKPSYVIEQSLKGSTPETWLDTKFEYYGTPENPQVAMLFGPKFLRTDLYNLSPIKDFELALMLVRPGSLFLNDLSKEKKFTKEGYGSVTRAFVKSDKDNAIPVEFQQWMIDNDPVKEVEQVMDSDHMVMLSRPEELRDRLLKIANNLA